MELLNAIVTTVNGVVWGWPMIILLLGTHIYMTAKTGFIQRFTITKQTLIQPFQKTLDKNF